MKTNRLYIFAALLGAVLVGCQKEENFIDEKPTEGKTWTLTVQATKDIDTKAMSLDGTTLKGYWIEGEAVGVYLGGTKLGTLTAGNITNEGANAVLSGTLDSVEGVTENSELMLLFPDKSEWSYLGQDGTAPSKSGTMATGFDYATATLTVSGIDGNTLTVDAAANFVSQQSVYRLRVKDGSDAIAVSYLTVTASKDKLVQSRTYENSDWKSNYGTLTMNVTAEPTDNLYYMAIRNDYTNTTEADAYTFFVVRKSDNAVLEGTRDIPAAALASPSYIPVSVSVSQKVMTQAKSGEISTVSDVL